FSYTCYTSILVTHFLSLSSSRAPRDLHSFPTRRSSDLCLIDAILADDRNVFFSLQFSHRLQSPQPAGIRSCCDQQPSFFGMPSKEVLHQPAAFLAQAFSVH